MVVIGKEKSKKKEASEKGKGNEGRDEGIQISRREIRGNEGERKTQEKE